MVNIFDWLGDILGGIGSAVGGVFDTIGDQVSAAIWDAMIRWFYNTIFDAASDFFTMMGNMGADIFNLSWVSATISVFTLFGWSLFIAGTVVAVFDIAIEYQTGRANVKTTAINVLKGFFACSLIGVAPVELYKFCISLQNTFAEDLTRIFSGEQAQGLSEQSIAILTANFVLPQNTVISRCNGVFAG